MKDTFNIILKYWKDPSTNIFKNYVDAIFGGIVMIIIPFVSIISVLFAKDISFTTYTFPIASICIAAAYDTYGRYEYKCPKNVKLFIRLMLVSISFILSIALVNVKCKGILLIPSILLAISGLLLIEEIVSRIMIGIKISTWGINERRK